MAPLPVAATGHRYRGRGSFFSPVLSRPNGISFREDDSEQIPRARPRKLQAKPRASFCGGSQWIRAENVPRKLHPRRRMSRRILDFYLVGKFRYLIDNRNILCRGKF